MTWQEILDAVKTEAQFDFTDAKIKNWILARAQKLNARAKWLVLPVTVGTAVAGQRGYTLASSAEIEEVLVDGVTYEHRNEAELDRLWEGTDYAPPENYFFALGWTSAGAPQLQLWPEPAGGESIVIRQVKEIAAPSDWSAESPPFPRDFDQALVHGAVATGLARTDGEVAVAQYHEGEFNQAIVELIDRKRGRRGRGPVRIAVAGRDF